MDPRELSNGVRSDLDALAGQTTEEWASHWRLYSSALNVLRSVSTPYVFADVHGEMWDQWIATLTRFMGSVNGPWMALSELADENPDEQWARIWQNNTFPVVEGMEDAQSA